MSPFAPPSDCVFPVKGMEWGRPYRRGGRCAGEPVGVNDRMGEETADPERGVVDSAEACGYVRFERVNILLDGKLLVYFADTSK